MMATITSFGELILALGAMALFLAALVKGLTLVTGAANPVSRPFYLRRPGPG